MKIGEENAVSCPQLVVQVKSMPDEGYDVVGEVPFQDIDLESDGRFELSAPMRYKLHLAQARQDIIVTGRLEADVMAVCDRCAEPAPLKLSVTDVFHVYKNTLGEPIDLTEDIREDILMSFPQSFHCSEDCKGLCPTCGQNLNEGTCSCNGQAAAEDDRPDPWAALANLNFKDK